MLGVVFRRPRLEGAADAIASRILQRRQDRHCIVSSWPGVAWRESPGGFAGLDAAKQDEILTTAEAGKLDGDPGGFFVTLLQQTREGMFSDPIYGGNVNFAGWDLIGYSGIKLVWDAEDQALDAIPAPEHASVAEFGGSAS